MRSLTLLLVLSSLCFLYSCERSLYSLHRNDNDFASYNDKLYVENVPLTKDLNGKFNIILEEVKKEIGSYDKLKDFYIHNVFVNDTFEMYVLTLNSFSKKEHQIYLYNKMKKQLSKGKVTVSCKYSLNGEDGFNEKLIDRPNIETRFIGNNLSFSIKKRFHNGTAYNAVIQKFYTVDLAQLSFKLSYCVEVKAISFEDDIIERIIDGDTVRVYKRNSSGIKEIGSFVISSDKQSIVSKNCLDERYCTQLVTCSEDDDQEFLIMGYSGLEY